MREVTVAQMVRRYGVDAKHGQDVAALAVFLYRSSARGEEEDIARNARLLGWAAQLREIGMSIAHGDFHKHGSYILSHCDLPGFSQHEQSQMAALILGQTGGLTKMNPVIEAIDEWSMVLCLRLAVIFHRRRDGQVPPWMRLKLKGANARIDLPAEWLAEHPLTDQSLRSEVAEWSKAGAFDLSIQPVAEPGYPGLPGRKLLA